MTIRVANILLSHQFLFPTGTLLQKIAWHNINLKIVLYLMCITFRNVLVYGLLLYFVFLLLQSFDFDFVGRKESDYEDKCMASDGE